LGASEATRGAVVLIGLFFLFPIVLLSMCEKNSPLVAVSLVVCRTFWLAWRGWVTFYFVTAVLLTAVLAGVINAFTFGAIWGMIAVALALGVVWLIYFRLLGRLAWYCTERTAAADLEEIEVDADTNPNEDDSVVPDDERWPSGGRS
jgi:hypothetical protein